MKKRVSSLLLATALVVGALPIEPTFAVGLVPETTASVTQDEYMSAVTVEISGDEAADPVPETTESAAPDEQLSVVPADSLREAAQNFNYELDGNGNASITAYTGTATTLSIPSTLDDHTVVSIGPKAFEGNKTLVSVSMADTVTKIDYYAFRNCTALSGLTLPKNLAELGYEAFEGCKALTAIQIPKTLTKAGLYGPFKGSGLKKAVIESGMTTLPARLFSGAAALTDVTIPDTVTKIEALAFQNCTALSGLTLPKNLAELGYEAFEGCKALTAIQIPKTLTKTGIYGPFKGSGLKKAVIESGMTTLPDDLFEGAAALTDVTIPKTVTKIGSEAFRGCTSLSSISIPDTVKTIGSGAFENCTALPGLTLPKNLTELGYEVFKGCQALTSIQIPKTLTKAGLYGPFNGSGLKKAVIESGMTTLPDDLFEGAAALTDVTIPKTVTQIGSDAFRGCTSLSKLALPEKLTTIGSDAFENSGFASFVLPASVTKIGYEAFQSCSKLKSFQWNNVISTIPSGCFQGCTSLTSFVIPDVVTEIKHNAFQNCDALKAIVIPDSVQTLEYSAFESCDMLSDVTLGYGLTEIPKKCFFECPELKKIELPYRVEKINSQAFANCVSLTEVTILRYVTTIAADAFSYLSDLTVRGVSGTYAESFAKDNGATFIPIKLPATSLKLNQTTLNFGKGEKFRLIPTVAPRIFTDAAEWKSADETVAKISQDGTVTAVGIGETTVTFTVGSKKASCKVAVIQKVTGITLNHTTASVNAGETLQLTATVKPNNASNKAVKWSSSDSKIATVDQNGLITAVKQGTVKITATAKDGSGVSASCQLTVHPAHTHSYDYKVTKKPTTSATGTLTGICAECKNSTTVTLPKLNKTDYTYKVRKTATCTEAGTVRYTWKVTEYGSFYFDLSQNALGHDWNEGVLTLKPDAAQSERRYTCARCGEKKTEKLSNKPFTDVSEGKYYYLPVLWAYYHTPQITAGTSGTQFSPNQPCTRGQVVTFLWRAYGEKQPKSNVNPFVDAKAGKYYYNAMLWAVENGVTSGVDATHFQPNGDCTRAQVVAFLWRAAGSPEPKSTKNPFVDVKESKFYYKAVLWALEKGITAGTDATHFQPNAICTRGQVVTFLYRQQAQ